MIVRKYLLFILLVLSSIYIFFFRSFYLQITDGDMFLNEVESLVVQLCHIDKERGLIMDTKGNLLVGNRLVVDLYVEPSILEDRNDEFTRIASEGLGLRMSEIENLESRIRNKSNAVLELSSMRCKKLIRWMNDKYIPGVQIIHCNLWINSTYFSYRESVLNRLKKHFALDVEFEYFYALALEEMRMRQDDECNYPILFVKDMDTSRCCTMEDDLYHGRLDGCILYKRFERRYYYTGLASHVIGFMNEFDIDDYSERREYVLDQSFGHFGIESQYDEELRGNSEVKSWFLDTDTDLVVDPDSIISSYGNFGYNILLTLDLNLQRKAEDLLRGEIGSIVVMDVDRGTVLAMASSPNFKLDDLDMFADNDMGDFFTNAPISPWINRAVQGCYSPGSVFKVVTTMAGLENRKINMKLAKKCRGRFRVKGGNWRCYYRKGHGKNFLGKALKTSCDAFFYETGYDIGTEAICDFSDILLLNDNTGIELDEEIEGLIPDIEYFYSSNYYFSRGFVINSAIGQGDVLLTPIQIAVIYNTLLNGGILYQPGLVKELRDVDGFLIEKKHPFILDFVENQKHLYKIKNALSDIFRAGGTGTNLLKKKKNKKLKYWMLSTPIIIGGKTGTAQVVNLSKNIDHVRVRDVEYAFRDNALFVGFSPITAPKILIVVIIEHGGFGGIKSAPLALKILKRWYEENS